MKKGHLIDIEGDIPCPICGKKLEFHWENDHGNRKIATCCFKEYWIKPSRIYEVEKVTEKLYDADPNCDHNIVPASGGGVKCTKCRGWFCF